MFSENEFKLEFLQNLSSYFLQGTVHGYTAMQLDLKVPGIRPEMVVESLERARNGLDHLLRLMSKAQPRWRNHFKSTVPVHETIPIAIYKRHIIFRSGGYNAKLIESETGAKVLCFAIARATLLLYYSYLKYIKLLCNVNIGHKDFIPSYLKQN